MSTATYRASKGPFRDRLSYQLRILRVIAGVEFKMKYADSALGYLWSLAKPMSYFGVLWLVFGRLFNTGIKDFPLYLLIGIVLFTFFTDSVGTALPSVVNRGALLRRIAFPPLVIPLSATTTSLMTFGVNILAVAVFVAATHLTPTLAWLLLIPLILELYVFVLGLALIISTLFVRLRDVGPLWELTAQLMLFASPVMYPLTILPRWAQQVVVLNPFVQVMQDVRRIMLGGQPQIEKLLGGGGAERLASIAVALAALLLGLWIHKRESPRFAEIA